MIGMDNRFNKSWYGDKAQVVDSDNDCVIIDYGCKGKGIITSYNLYDGITLCFLDFYTDEIMPSQKFNPDIISIVHCQAGRYECEFSNHQMFYLSEGYFSIMGTKHLPISFSFPLKKCYAFSLVIDKHALSADTQKILNDFCLDMDKISERLKLNKNGYLSHADFELGHLFEEFYNTKDKESITYFRVKAIEFLYFINKLSGNEETEFRYFNKKYIQITKDVCKYMTEHLEEKVSLEQLAYEKGINLSLLYKVFAQVYGDTPYSYIKKYKMNIASNELRNSKRKINDIALSLGYSNASKFSIAFQSVYGILPKDYRKAEN